MFYKKFARIAAVFTILVILQFPAVVYSQQTEIPITTYSEEALSFFMEGRYRFENIQYANAAALFDEAILTDPGFAMAYLYRARCGGGYNIVKENMGKAEALINNVSDGEKYLILFQKALQDEDHIAQKENIMKLLELFPNDKRAHFNAGLYYDFIFEPETALMHYFKATKIDPKYAAAYNKIGYDFIDLGFLSAAEEAFKKYIALIPDSPNPYDSYAELLMKLGQHEESIRQYQTAYQKDVLYTQALAGVGHNYVFLGEYEKARDNYHKQHDKATRMNEKIEALRWVAVSYLHEGKIDEAISTLEIKAKFAENENLLPDIIQSYNMMGMILMEFGQYDKAKEKYDLVSKIINDSELDEHIAMDYKVDAHINHCLWLTKSNNMSDAETEISKCDKVVEGRNNLAERQKLNMARGIFALNEGRTQDAIDYFNEADSESPYVWYYLAETYDKLGYSDRASAYRDRIKYWNGNSLEYAIVRNKNLLN